ncbi:hypothetical protein [Hydrogenobaculum acidophilum]
MDPQSTVNLAGVGSYFGGQYEINPGPVTLSINITPVVGSMTGNSVSVTSGTFMIWAFPYVRLYLPSVQSGSAFGGWLKVSLPQGVSSTALMLNVLNNPGVTCSVTWTSTSGNVYYTNLANLASECTGNVDWTTGAPIEVTIEDPTVKATDVAAYAYQMYDGFLKRIPVDIVAPEQNAFGQAKYNAVSSMNY